MFSHKVYRSHKQPTLIKCKLSCQTKLNYCVFPNSVFVQASKQNYWWSSFLKIEKIASYEFKMKNWYPFPMTFQETFIKGKCTSVCHRRWKKSSNIWKHCDRSGKINFSHSFLLIVAYLIIEVAAFQQNFGRKGESSFSQTFLSVYVSFVIR